MASSGVAAARRSRSVSSDGLLLWAGWAASRAAVLLVAVGVGLRWHLLQSAITSDVTKVYLPVHWGLLHGQVPYRDVVVNYPPGFLPFLVLPVWHVAPLARSFVVIYLTQMIVVDGAALAVLRRSRLPRARLGSWIWMLGGAASLGTVFGRNDLPSCLCVVAGCVLLVQGRTRRSAWALSLGVLSKLWPVLLLAFVAVCDRRRARAVLTALLGVGMPTLLVLRLVGALAPAVDQVFGYNGGRGVEVEAVPALPSLLRSALTGSRVPLSFDHGSFNIAGTVGLGQVASLAALVALGLVGVLAVRARGGAHDGARLAVLSSATALGWALLTTKVFSAQYVIWLVAVGAVAAAVGVVSARSAVLVVAVQALTSLAYPMGFPGLLAGHVVLLAGALTARDLVLALVVASWTRALWRAGATTGDVAVRAVTVPAQRAAGAEHQPAVGPAA